MITETVIFETTCQSCTFTARCQTADVYRVRSTMAVFLAARVFLAGGYAGVSAQQRASHPPPVLGS
jgi:hypothetical protein